MIQAAVDEYAKHINTCKDLERNNRRIKINVVNPFQVQSVACDVMVYGAGDPTGSANVMASEALFYVELKPKGYTFPEGFSLSQMIAEAADLEAYLNDGADMFDEEQNWQWVAPEEEDEFVKCLPSPFNKMDSYVQLTWTTPDVMFDPAAYISLDLYCKTFTAEELKADTVGVLKIIARVKRAESASKKDELIANILKHQERKTPLVLGQTKMGRYKIHGHDDGRYDGLSIKETKNCGSCTWIRQAVDEKGAALDILGVCTRNQTWKVIVSTPDQRPNLRHCNKQAEADA